jgi:hypothetical protein
MYLSIVAAAVGIFARGYFILFYFVFLQNGA